MIAIGELLWSTRFRCLKTGRTRRRCTPNLLDRSPARGGVLALILFLGARPEGVAQLLSRKESSPRFLSSNAEDYHCFFLACRRTIHSSTTPSSPLTASRHAPQRPSARSRRSACGASQRDRSPPRIPCPQRERVPRACRPGQRCAAGRAACPRGRGCTGPGPASR